jgi:hypothetical protein
VATFYYKDRQFVTSRRGELFGPTDFLGKVYYDMVRKGKDLPVPKHHVINVYEVGVGW